MSLRIGYTRGVDEYLERVIQVLLTFQTGGYSEEDISYTIHTLRKEGYKLIKEILTPYTHELPLEEQLIRVPFVENLKSLAEYKTKHPRYFELMEDEITDLKHRLEEVEKIEEIVKILKWFRGMKRIPEAQRTKFRRKIVEKLEKLSNYYNNSCYTNIYRDVKGRRRKRCEVLY